MSRTRDEALSLWNRVGRDNYYPFGFDDWYVRTRYMNDHSARSYMTAPPDELERTEVGEQEPVEEAVEKIEITQEWLDAHEQAVRAMVASARTVEWREGHYPMLALIKKVRELQKEVDDGD